MLIPSPPADFCGRHREIDKLMELFDSQKVIIIAGLAGIGKTSLASAFVDRIRKQSNIPERFIWISCQEGWDNKDLYSDIGSKLHELLSMKNQNLVPEKPEFLIDKIEKNNLILIIDDFHLVENEETRKLILLSKEYFKKSKLIIISRRRVKLNPIDRIDILERRLDGLNLEDSANMIKKLFKMNSISSITENEINQIYYKVKGHPLLMKLFVSLLTSGGFDIKSLLDTASQFEEEMENFLFDRIWQGLSDQEKHTLKVLAIPRIPVSKDHYPFIKDKYSLKSLRDRFLIENYPEGKISIHSLLRDYTLSRFEESELLKLRINIAEFFMNSLKPKISELKESCYLFELSDKVERSIDSIIKMGELFLILGEDIEFFHQVINDALEKGKGYKYEELMQWKIRILLHLGKTSQALKLIKNIKDKYDQWILKSSLYTKMSDYKNAKKYFLKVLKKPKSSKDKIIALNGLAICFEFTSSLAESEKFFKCALEELKNNDLPLLKARIKGNFANLLCDMGRLPEALEYYIEAENIYKSFNAIGSLGLIQYNLAFTYIELGDYDKAQKLLDDSYESKKKTKDYPGMAYLFNLLSALHLKKNNIEKALKFNQKAYDTAIAYCNDIVQTEILGDFTILYMRLDRLKEAEVNINLVLKKYQALGNSFKLAEHKINNAILQYLCNKKEKTKEILHSVLEYASKNGHSRLILESSYILSVLYRMNGESEKFEKISEKYFTEGLKFSPEYRKELENNFNWFLQKIMLKKENDFIIITEKNNFETNKSKAEEFRKKIENYDIFIDFPKKSLFVKGKEIHFFKKRTLVPLFKTLLDTPGEIIPPDIIFKKVWKRDYNPEYDGVTLRVNISRLRSILEEKKNKIKFIGHSENGGYYFNRNTNFCIIVKK